MLLLSFLTLLILPVRGLYFYLEGSEQKCFIEELPKDTVVVGTYKTEEFQEQLQAWVVNPSVSVQITVDEIPDMHRVLNQKGSPSGKFTFTSAEAGDHSLCFTANTGGWWNRGQLKFHLELSIGEDPMENSQADAKQVLGDMTTRLRDLNSRVAAIRREQQYQREREAEFRDTSEATNSRVVWWTVAQLAILALTALWQMRHLKSFFVAKKLV